jgi:ribosomal protein S18 acetylase RimI-like enzyme
MRAPPVGIPTTEEVAGSGSAKFDAWIGYHHPPNTRAPSDSTIRAAGLTPSSDLARCFEEFYRKQWAKEEQEPPAGSKALKNFAKKLRAVPAEWPIRSYLQLAKSQQRVVEAGAVVDSRSWRRFLDSAVFLSVNGRDENEQPLTVEAAFLEAVKAATRPLSVVPASDVTQHSCKFTSDHARIRSVAYPYTPACNSGVNSNDDVIEIRVGGVVAGYVVVDLASGYIDDLCVDPAYSGLGLGSQLLGASAEAVLNYYAKGRHHPRRHNGCLETARLTLHVRAANRPATSLYRSLGLEIGELEFPHWFDWHGGYELEASCEEVIGKVKARASQRVTNEA